MAKFGFVLVPGGGGGVPSADVVTYSALAAMGDGMMFMKNGVPFAAIPRGIYPLDITDPDGGLGTPRFVMAPPTLMGPRWRPDTPLQALNGAVAGDQVIYMGPYRRYVIERIDVIDATATPGALTFGVYTKEGGAAGGGRAVLPAGTTLAGLTGELRSRKTFAGLDAPVESEHLYLNVTTPNAGPLSFVMMFHGRVLAGNDE
ncbi:hypothetical protein [Methylopila sp. 73B]|uniref:hypothetical protein n=1 Tax=Methylopila sp. 73B TaxID=1120792 RepID=UPI00039D0827|nr:hypothetical protein [Methylopila sp. 73B]